MSRGGGSGVLHKYLFSKLNFGLLTQVQSKLGKIKVSTSHTCTCLIKWKYVEVPIESHWYFSVTLLHLCELKKFTYF